ncbi:MAG: hypothetical protein R3C68_11875 [Myxococcota bacterium]
MINRQSNLYLNFQKNLNLHTTGPLPCGDETADFTGRSSTSGGWGHKPGRIVFRGDFVNRHVADLDYSLYFDQGVWRPLTETKSAIKNKTFTQLPSLRTDS